MRKIFNDLITWLYQKYVVIENTPRSYGIITKAEVAEILKSYCDTINFSDPDYELTTMMDAKYFTKISKINDRKYIKNKNDCENFSFALLGYWSDSLKSFCFGYARSRTHAFNIMIDNKKKVWICEPQSNRWMLITDEKDEQYLPITLILL